MAIEIKTPKGKEGSTYTLVVTCRDDAEQLITPLTMKWTWTDTNRNIINGKVRQNISSPSSIQEIDLYGDDLLITESGKEAYRLFLVEATYNSDRGIRPLVEEAKVTIEASKIYPITTTTTSSTTTTTV